MKKVRSILALSLGSLLAVSALAACKPKEIAESTEEASWGAQICYDNLDDDITLDEAYTSITIEDGAYHITARSADDSKVSDFTKIADYDAKTCTFTAKSAGTLFFTMKDGRKGLIQVVPAYATKPTEKWYYTGDSSYDLNEEKSPTLGHTHDPSIIEVEENGRPVYYMVSTGWGDTSKYDGMTTWGNPIRRSTDMLTWEYMGRTFDYGKWDEEFKGSDVWKWLYDGKLGSGYSEKSAGWWAPDIVPCPSGGYWLYTCIVDGSGDQSGMSIGSKHYARAAIMLYHADKIEAGAFKYVGVLMQSSIERGEKARDVNGIDPQIIYTPDGKMYMAYGSFGSGNYIIELDPETGLRKDGKGWQTHEDIRKYVEEDIQKLYAETKNTEAGGKSIGWTHEYYGTNISKQNMEAPVIARHDNVVISDENGVITEAKTYYYSMHSYNGLSDAYMMWGGRSEEPTGVYKSATGKGIVYNENPSSKGNEGNKYLGAFKWATKSADSKEIDIILPGHNDLFTMLNGTSVAAYITRTPSYKNHVASATFTAQVHQYYLNSMGDIVINPNRYAGEAQRGVTEAELLKYTKDGKFKMVVMANHLDADGADRGDIQNVSRDVILTSDHRITEADGTALGTWVMYGNGYIKFTFSDTLKGTNKADSEEKVYYGVVRSAWLGDQNKSGFTITCMGHTNETRSMAMFMNNYSTIEGSGLVG